MGARLSSIIADSLLEIFDVTVASPYKVLFTNSDPGKNCNCSQKPKHGREHLTGCGRKNCTNSPHFSFWNHLAAQRAVMHEIRNWEARPIIHVNSVRDFFVTETYYKESRGKH